MVKPPGHGGPGIGMHDSVFESEDDVIGGSDPGVVKSIDPADVTGPDKVKGLGAPPAASDVFSSGKVAGKGAIGAKFLTEISHASGLPSSKESLTHVLETLWQRKQDVAMQPHPGSAIRIVGGNEAERPMSVKPDVYLKHLLGVAKGRPPGSQTHSKLAGDTAAWTKKVRSAVHGEVGWPAIARSSIFFDRAGADPTASKEQIFINARADHIPELVEELVNQIVDKPGQYPGVSRLKVAGPYKSGRTDTLIFSTDGGDSSQLILQKLVHLQKSHPDWFEDSVVPLTKPVLSGVSMGDMPASGRYPGQSFNGLRTQVLHSVACEAVQQKLTKAEFDTLFKARWAEAGLDFEAPHLHTPDVEDVATTVVAMEGSQKVSPGTINTTVTGFDGVSQHDVEIVIPEKVGKRLGKRNVRFFPKQGLFAKVDVDRTRNPPRERIIRQSAASFVDDTRFRIDFGKEAPPYVHYNPTQRRYHVPKKVTLNPPASGQYGLYVFTPEVDEGRPTQDAPMMLKLVQKLNSGQVTGDELAKVMGRIEKYLTDDAASTKQRVVLEEGTNGVSVLSLTNKGVGIWKPSAAEYPEQTRLNLEPDHQARREAFAYFLSKKLGHLGRVPPTIFRKVDGEEGSICALSRGTLPGTHSPKLGQVLADPSDPIYQEMAVFDCLVGNLDRHSGNILMGDDAALAIDHGMAFPLSHGDQADLNYLFEEQVKLTDEQRTSMTALLGEKDEIRKEAKRLDIASEAVERLIERLEHMVKTGATYNEWRTAPPVKPAAE